MSGIAADSLGAARIGELAWTLCKQHVAEVVLVSDAAIVEAQRRLWSEVRVVAEPGGATALAALLSGGRIGLRWVSAWACWCAAGMPI